MPPGVEPGRTAVEPCLFPAKPAGPERFRQPVSNCQPPGPCPLASFLSALASDRSTSAHACLPRHRFRYHRYSPLAAICTRLSPSMPQACSSRGFPTCRASLLMPFQNIWQHLSRQHRAHLSYMYMQTIPGVSRPPVYQCCIPYRLLRYLLQSRRTRLIVAIWHHRQCDAWVDAISVSPEPPGESIIAATMPSRACE